MPRLLNYSRTKCEYREPTLDVIILYKKAYCRCEVDGDYVLLLAHDLEDNRFQQQYRHHYTDWADPSGADANEVKAKIDLIIESYAADARFGAYYDTTTQTNGGATTANIIVFDSEYERDGTENIGSGKLKVYEPGLYSVTLRAEFDKTNNTDSYADVWLRKNLVDIAESKTHFEMVHKDTTYAFTLNFILSLVADDYIQFAWHSPNLTVRLLAEAAGASPTRPAGPSVIANIFQIR